LRAIFHALLRFAIRKLFTESFRSNIDDDALHTGQMLTIDMFIVDQVSMLISWLANQASMTSQQISVHG
jgi:hypothetical protein